MKFPSILLITATLFAVSGGTLAVPGPLRARALEEQPVFIKRDVEIYGRSQKGSAEKDPEQGPRRGLPLRRSSIPFVSFEPEHRTRQPERGIIRPTPSQQPQQEINRTERSQQPQQEINRPGERSQQPQQEIDQPERSQQPQQEIDRPERSQQPRQRFWKSLMPKRSAKG